MKFEANIPSELVDLIVERLFERIRPLLSGKGSDAEDKIFTVKQLSGYIGLSTQWIYNNKKNIPHFNRRRKPLFRKSEIDGWLETFKKEPGSSGFRNISTTKKQEQDISIQRRSFKPQKGNAPTSL